jgi:formylglycine-generating enzyme required for sulfatase activity
MFRREVFYQTSGVFDAQMSLANSHHLSYNRGIGIFTMPRPLRVFLCHSSNDKPTVRELYQKLRAETWIQPWLDEEELYPGQDWNMEIEKAVEAADAIIVCLSKGSITKEGYIQRELRIVLDFADYKPEGTLYIIPVRLEECEPPRRLRAWQYADYFEGQRGRAFQRLLVSLKRRADALGLPAEELVRNEIEEHKKRGAAEKATGENMGIETVEKTALEKAKIVQEEKAKRRRERYIRENAKKYDSEKKIQKLVDQIFNWVSLNSRWLGIGVVVLFALIFGAFGLNYIVNNLPDVTSPTSSPTKTATSPNSTSIPSTPTPQSTQTVIPTPTLGIGSTMIGEKGETLVYVPAGEFTMGSENGGSDEEPVHTVYVDAFWIDQTEVTNKQYKACVDAGTCEPPSATGSYTHPNYYGNPEFDDYPVIYVNWDKANRYCEMWTGGDLPTEAEWEKAARGTDGRIYPWGNDAPNKDLLNYNQNVGDTTEVGKYPDGKSIYGAYDMAGNVWEWVNDWYGETYYQSSNSSNNPLGPESGQYRVLRGGSWYVVDNVVRSALRLRYVPPLTGYNIGFRCSRSP